MKIYSFYCRYHIAVNKDFIVTQVGFKLGSLFPLNENKEPLIIGKHASEYFSITTPHTMPWNLRRMLISKDGTFDLALNSLSLLSKVHVKKLHLSGGIIVSDPKSDPDVKEFGIIFLVNLKIKILSDLSESGFTLSDISKYAFQRELILAGKIY